MHDQRFPNESADYRAARDALLQAELELRRKAAEVATLRSALPLGGEVGDYTFAGPTGPVALADLFREGCDTLLLYSFMYGPTAERPCPMCASFLDGLNANAAHLTSRVPLHVIARSPLPRIQAFAEARGWANLPLLSSAENTYNLDYGAETPTGSQLPAMNVFVRREGRVHHFWSSELLYMGGDEGQDPRHLDLLWPLWNVLDLTPGGRGAWYPPLEA